MILDELRLLLADITGRASLRHLPADLPLFRDGAGLDSLSGVHLLAAVQERYGVDVAAEDLNLDALRSLRALADFLAQHGAAGPHAGPGPAAPPAPKVLHLIDAVATVDGVLADTVALSRELRAAVTGAGGRVLAERQVVFPNGAVTLVLILAESHLSVHTWPEEDLVAVDLFSCGGIDGEAVLARLARTLGLRQVRLRQVPRGRPASVG
jgi:S-adenosylmethionine decarboxylase